MKAMPPRYASRFPEPLRAMAVPVQSSPLLPTVAAPENAAALLLSTPTIAPTSEPTLVATTDTDDVDDDESEPTITPSPIPSATVAPTATPAPTLDPIPATHRLENVPHKFQTWNNCGPATMAMALSYFGDNYTQEETAVFMKPNAEDRNVTPEEMAAFVNEETPLQAISRANGDLDTVRHLLAADVPVVLHVGIDPPGEFSWLGWYGHYLLAVAYDDELEQFWVYDSWFGTSEEPLQNASPEGRVLPYAEFEERWVQFNDNYIAVYRSEQAETVAAIIGDDMDDDTMWARAMETAQANAQADPENAFHWFNLGTIYTAMGQYDEAVLAYDQARAIGLPWRMLWYQFGPYKAYYENGRYEDVIFLADTTLLDRPYFEESFYYRGIAHAAMGDITDARRDLESAVEFNPHNTLAAEALETINN